MDFPGDSTLIDKEAPSSGIVSFLVQFFGISEITESFENRNLLVSKAFKDKIDEVDNETTIQCFFLFHDVKALVGHAEILRKIDENDDGGQEPFEIEMKWAKLVMLPYNDISADAAYIIKIIESDGDMNWEHKEISEDQRKAFESAITHSAGETVDSLVSKYEVMIQPPSSALEDESGASAENQRDEDVSHADERSDRKRERSRDRSSRDRSGSRSRQSGRDENFPQEAPKRSRIPFDVTKMSYDQYCAKHYSYAIEMYRAEKLAQYNAAQAARAMAMGLPMGMPMHMMNQGAGIGMPGAYGMAGGGYGQPVGQAAIAPGYGQPVGQDVGQGGYGMNRMGNSAMGMGIGTQPQAPMAGGYYGQQGQTGYGAPVQLPAAPLP